jgi:hypothetical protein
MWQLVICLGVWVAVAYKAMRVRAAPTPANKTLLAMLVFPAVAATAAAPTIYRWIGQTSDVANLAVLIVTSAGLLGLVPCLNVLLHRRHHPDVASQKARRRWAWFGLLALVQAALWAMTEPAPITPLFGLTQAADPIAVAYLVVHQGALAVTGLICFLEASRMARQVSGELRMGLWVVALSGLGAVLVVAWNSVYYASVQWGSPVRSTGWALLPVWAVYLSVLGLALGVTVPDWGPRLLRRLEARRALHDLEPLWATLVDAAPEVQLPDAYSRWDVHRRLHRRVVEIHDAELALRGRTDCSDAVVQVAAAVRLTAEMGQEPTSSRGGLDRELANLLAIAGRLGPSRGVRSWWRLSGHDAPGAAA